MPENANPRVQLCNQLIDHRDTFVARAMGRAAACGVPLAAARLRREVEACLDTLILSVDIGMPSLFANHVAWSMPAMIAGVSRYTDVFWMLRSLRLTLLEALPVALLPLVARFLLEAGSRLAEVSERFGEAVGDAPFGPLDLIPAVAPSATQPYLLPATTDQSVAA